MVKGYNNQELLLSYHEKFEIFFNDLINIIMPDDYRINEIDIFDYASVISEIKKYKTMCNGDNAWML